MHCQLLVNKPKSDNMKAQLKELAFNDMLKTLYLILTKKSVICLSIPVMTENFFQMKLPA